MSNESENEQEVMYRILEYVKTELKREGLLAYSQGRSGDIGLIIIHKSPNAKSIQSDDGKWVITIKSSHFVKR